MSTGTRGTGHASKVDRDAATKHTTVEFVEKDDDEQVVTGVVMSPMSVDRQGDYETPETIETFADDFKSFYDNDFADGGIMHAAWPSEWMNLSFNGIVGRDELPADISEMDLEAGKWVQQWDINDAGLWSLIDDEIFQGFSIGARNVEWRGPLEQSDLPEGVGVPDEYDDDDPVWELQSGEVREVSAVDTPAVPEALVLSKDDAEKALQEYLGDRDGFLAEMEQRGHSTDDAERVWDVMSRAVDVDGADSPGKESFFTRIGKAVWGRDDGTDDASGAETQTRADSTDKEGRTLSRANRDSAKAAIDANLDLLEDAGVDHGMTRFTDRDEDAFDLTEHSARTWATDDTDDEDEDDTTETMSDTTDDTDDPVLAEVKALREDMEELKSDPEGDEPDDGKDATDDDPDGPDTAELADAVETLTDEVKSLKETAESNADAIDTIGKQAGYSTQVSGGADKNGDGGDDESGLDQIKAALS